MILIIELPEVLEKKFAEPSFDFFGDAEVKALKDVDMYDFLDYMIGRGQQNQATSELKDALIGLKKLESSQPNPPNPSNTPPTKQNDQASTTKTNQSKPSEQNLSSADFTKNPPPTAEGDKGGGLFDLPNQAQNQTPNKTTLQKDLSVQEVKEAVQKWDLDNPNANDKLLVSLVQGDELEKLSKEFDFKGNYAIAREIDSKGIKHALIQHGDEAKESARGQIAITKDDIAQYQQFTQNPDLRILQKNNRIVYAKQVNGHYVVIEEVLTGQNKLQFFDMWKGKGKINEEVLLSHSQRPKHDFEPNSNRRMPSNTDEIIHKSTQNNPKTKLETTYLQRENLKREIDELEKEYFKQRRAADGSILPPKIDALSQSKRQKLDYKRNELIEKAKALTNEIMQNHKILKTLKELNSDEQINEAVLRNLINPNQTEAPIKVIYKDIQKSGDEAMFINKQRALEYHDRAKNETKNNTLLRVARKQLEKAFNIEPIKEFGTNYAEFYQDGKGAIAKLIAEANAAKQVGQDFSGQVAGAFSKEIDGAPARIDLVWGQITNAQTHEGYGLAHIIDKHPELDLNLIPQIIEKGQVESKNGIHSLILQQEGKEYRIGLGKGWKGKGDNEWIITAYENKKVKENGETFYHDTFTAKEPLENLDNQIIQKISQKFNKDEKYAKNLYEWHKDSHPFTKEADGTPKVFYHGSKADFEVFKRQNKAELGHFFTDIKSYANTYKNKNGKLYKAFLHIKNPMDLRDKKLTQKYSKAIFGNDLAQLEKRLKQNLNGLKPTLHDLKGEWMRLRMDKHKKLDTNYIFAKKAEELGFDGIIDFNGALVVFDSNQIKEVGNKGTFDATNPNIYHSSSTAGGGVLGGAIAGVEKDDEGNIIGFSPEKFALGFAAGASGAKVLSSNFAKKYAKNIDIIADKKLKQGNKMENQKLKTRLDKAKTQNEIIDLPTQSFKNIKEFNKLFDSQNGAMGTIKTPYKNIQVRIPYAYRHFYQNTNNKNRDGIKSAFFETFRNPLFITKEKRGGKDSIYFYKPFYDKDKNIINLFGIGVDSKNKVDFKTFYLDEIETRIKQVLKVSDENVLYIKK